MKTTSFKTIRGPLLGMAAMFAAIPAAHALEADEIFRRVQDSVMVVRVYDEKDTPLGQGSAVLVAPENLLTNCHVLAKSKRIEIRHENVSYGAELVHIDLERDLCQIRARNYRARPVEIGNSDAVRVGKKVYALGNPRGLELTLSDGLVSALRKDKNGILQFIQTSAPISPGSSGGGLFDSDGKLIGITTLQRVDSQNLNFAIPINMYRELPERSRIALAKAAEKKAAAQASAAKPSEKTEEKLLLAQELVEHFGKDRSVSAVWSGTAGNINIYMRTSSDGRASLSAPPKNGSTVVVTGTGDVSGKFGGIPLTNASGRWRLKDGGQVCLDFSYGGFELLQGCYRVFATGPKKYQWRSVQDSNTIQYSEE